MLMVTVPELPLADEPLLIATDPLWAALFAEAVDNATDSPTLLLAVIDPPDSTKRDLPLPPVPTASITLPLLLALDAPLVMETAPLEPSAVAPETSDKAPELPELLVPVPTWTAPLWPPAALPSTTAPVSETADDPLRICTLPPWLPALTSTPALAPDPPVPTVKLKAPAVPAPAAPDVMLTAPEEPTTLDPDLTATSPLELSEAALITFTAPLPALTLAPLENESMPPVWPTLSPPAIVTPAPELSLLPPARSDTLPATCADPVPSTIAPLLFADDAPVWIETLPLTPSALVPLLIVTLPLALALSEVDTTTAPLEDPAPEDSAKTPPSPPEETPAPNRRAVPAPEPE